ncbi:MAG: polymer-forming cytoskeletal protein [Deltaproteobacteria bacterium]|nr:polymer-forming cytoskeletal protein [Deltaproteobacteria bacterium]
MATTPEKQSPSLSTTGTNSLGHDASKTSAEPFSVISRDICIEGELEGSENLTIEGRFKGRIQSQGDIIISATGNVEAVVLARNITIQGRVNGNIEAREAVEIQQQGTLIGDCRARSIQIREGARFEGRSEILK